jgi:asparagine synthase (glutamine-hydrolysing)
MCGIAGYVGTEVLPGERIDRCLARMRRRGPDAAAAFEAPAGPGRRAYLLHSRLSIIDLAERSNQPFHRAGRVLAYNGELYNYLELRQELAALGEAFQTSGDTEVLGAALGRWGWRGLERCEGMWAFALFDEATGGLLLGRDRFGEKPLFLYTDATGLFFGSEAKFVFALLGRALPVNHEHLHRYLVNGYKSLYKGPQTFFRGLAELPPATVLEVRPGGEAVRHRYWKPAFAPDDSLGYDDCVAAAREALVRSVKLRLRADVPLAFCMSGGIDSNALISIARRVLDYDVEGFTIVNSDRRYDEWELVAHSVAELGVRHQAVPVTTADFLPRLRELVRYHDAPVYTITYYAQWLLMECVARAGYRIAISGTGADELFSGYYDHHNAYLYEMRRDARAFDRALRDWEEHIRPIVRNPYLGNPRVFLENPQFRDHIYLDADRFAGFLYRPYREAFHEQRYCPDLLRNRMLNELFHEAVPVILHEDDLNAMYYSVENRSPFLDRGLFEVCSRMPTRHLIRGGYAKAVLRDAVRGIAPERVLNNHRKVGFNAPILSFLDVNDASVREQLLDPSPIFEHVRRDRIEELLTKAELPNSQSKFLFSFVNSKIFLEECAA